MAEIEFIEDVKDTVKDFKKKVGDKNFYIIVAAIGGIGLYLLLKKDEYTGELMNASEIVGYPSYDSYGDSLSGDSSGGSSSDSGSSGDAGSGDSSGNDGNGAGSIIGGGSTSGGGSASNGGQLEDAEDEEENRVIAEWVSGTTNKVYDTTTKDGAFWDYYNQMTGGGDYITKEYEDGSKKTFYRPNNPQGVDTNGDGGISVSFDRDGNVISSEFTDGDVSVHKYGDEVTTTIHSSDRRESSSTTIKQDVTTLPTYTGSSSSSKGGTSITVNRGSSSSNSSSSSSSSSSSNSSDVASKIFGSYTSSSGSKSTATVSKPGANAKPIG